MQRTSYATNPGRGIMGSSFLKAPLTHPTYPPLPFRKVRITIAAIRAIRGQRSHPGKAGYARRLIPLAVTVWTTNGFHGPLTPANRRQSAPQYLTRNPCAARFSCRPHPLHTQSRVMLASRLLTASSLNTAKVPSCGQAERHSIEQNRRLRSKYHSATWRLPQAGFAHCQSTPGLRQSMSQYTRKAPLALVSSSLPQRLHCQG
jgi:hypothetical protein